MCGKLIKNWWLGLDYSCLVWKYKESNDSLGKKIQWVLSHNDCAGEEGGQWQVSVDESKQTKHVVAVLLYILWNDAKILLSPTPQQIPTTFNYCSRLEDGMQVDWCIYY